VEEVPGPGLSKQFEANRGGHRRSMVICSICG